MCYPPLGNRPMPESGTAKNSEVYQSPPTPNYTRLPARLFGSLTTCRSLCRPARFRCLGTNRSLSFFAATRSLPARRRSVRSGRITLPYRGRVRAAVLRQPHGHERHRPC